MMTKLYTLCYLSKDGKTLMQNRRDVKEDYQRNVYNAPGGKVEQSDKGFTECILREFKDETGLTLLDPRLRGMIIADLEGEIRWVAIYSATSSEGDLQVEDREGRLEWIANGDLPRLPTWGSDRYIWPLLKQEKIFELHVKYGPDRRILEHSVKFIG